MAFADTISQKLLTVIISLLPLQPSAVTEELRRVKVTDYIWTSEKVTLITSFCRFLNDYKETIEWLCSNYEGFSF